MQNKTFITKAQNQEFTQAELVLAVLQFRKKATTSTFEDLGIKSPSAVICKLNKSNNCIKSKLICGKAGKTQAEYRLNTSSKSVNQTTICKNSMMEEM